MMVGIILVAVAIAVGIFSFGAKNFPSLITSPNPPQLYNCGELQIDVNSMKEATAYYRFGIPKPSGTDHKFEILDMKVTNNANAFEDLSGFRLKLVADNGNSYAPTQFNSIEKITLIDSSVIDYSCSELGLASISQFGLNSTQSAEGCKIFLVLTSLTPASLEVYNVTGLKCAVPLV
jgi:hypothetical protein